jgi:WS/DGAT/MGAT family acyltransferase
MHVGWAAVFEAPADGARPSFEDLRAHIAIRLGRARRYRQRLASVPFGVHDPMWVDDDRFDLDQHVYEARSGQLQEVVDLAMSTPLVRSRPLWELWIAPRLADGRIGVVGKAHHCMVDGLAAVELAALLLDPAVDPDPIEPVRWEARPAPGSASLLLRGAIDRVRGELRLLRLPQRIVTSPRRVIDLIDDARRGAVALAHTFGSSAPASVFNQPTSALRHLAMAKRPLDDLRAIKQRHGTTINDVVLAASAGAVRRFLQDRGEPPVQLKAMVPVSVRASGGGEELGNRIAFTFMKLPCHEPDPVSRLAQINRITRDRKRAGEPRGADAVLSAAAYAPPVVQHALARLVSSPRTFNLVVSNIPGPAAALYMHGCKLSEAYPVVPLADRHAVSIGFTTVAGQACFGIYADRRSLPDSDLLAQELDEAIEELLADSDVDRGHSTPPVPGEPLAGRR